MFEYAKKLKKKPRFISGLAIDEISLVDRAASGLRFAVLKQDQADSLIKEIRAFYGDDTAAAAETIAKAADLTPEKARALSEALAMLKKYFQDMPDDVVAAIKTLAGFSLEFMGTENIEDPESGDEAEADESQIGKGGGFDRLARELVRLSGARSLNRAMAKWDRRAPLEDDDDDSAPEPEKARRVSKRSIDGQEDGESVLLADDEAQLWPSFRL